MRQAILGGLLALFLVGAGAAPARSRPVGDWQVEIDPMTEMLTQFRTEVATARVPLIIRAKSFDVKFDGDAIVSRQDKLAILARWTGVVVEALKVSGLRPMDGPGSTAQQRQQLAEMRQKLVDRMPFGLRSQMCNRIGNIPMLMDDSRAACTARDGAYAAFVMEFRPQESVASDFGSLGVIAIGFGACGESGRYAEVRLDNTWDRAERALFDELLAHGVQE